MFVSRALLRRPRLPFLAKDQLPDLNKVHPILDFEGGHFNQKFPVTKPEVILNSQLENDNETLSAVTGLTVEQISKLLKKALIIKRVVHVTGKGKMQLMYSLVVVGNGEGVAGYGEGKHEEVIMAIKKATNVAIKNLHYFERYDERTIYHDIEHKFGASRLKLMARPPGFGLRCNHYVHEICKCVGIHDLTGKVRGSTNGMNVIKATFEALAAQRLPQDIARQR
ncbi:6715_t:CDS:2, partial [Ambispora leptoticha]